MSTPGTEPGTQSTRTAADLGSRGLHAPTRAEQRTARIMGAWFLGTFVFSIPAFFFYDPLLNHASYVTGSGHDTRVGVGALLEILLGHLRHRHRRGHLPDREAGQREHRPRVHRLTHGGVDPHPDRGPEPDVGRGAAPGLRPSRQQRALVDVARGLLAVHDQTALLGPQFCAGLGNGILLGYLMWRSRLLPRPMVMIGLIGGPLAVLAGVGVLLGAWDITAGLPVALTVPEAIWEFSLSVWLLAKGFRPSPILTGAPVGPAPGRPATAD